MKHFILGLVFTLWMGAVCAQKLSPESKISLITIGPGTELYSGFGHSLLWVYDPVKSIDQAYNYGTFNFKEGNFYVKFLRGTLPYSLSVASLLPQIEYSRYENRSVTEQILNLSQTQKEKFFQYLENNAKPENKQFQYKFFYDNCSTRLAVALKAVCGDSLIYHGYPGKPRSFRQWIDQYAYVQNPWADFGMDLAIGAPSDEVATADQATFLPDNLSTAFDSASLKVDNKIVPLVSAKRVIFEASPIEYETTFTPKNVFWTLAIIVLAFTYWQIKKGQINFIFDKILFSTAGLTGWLILILWFGTNHGVTSLNFDILWALPIWLPAIWFISKSKKPFWFQFLLLSYGFLLLCATGNLAKHNLVIIPILVILSARIYYINNSLSKIPSKE